MENSNDKKSRHKKKSSLKEVLESSVSDQPEGVPKEINSKKKNKRKKSQLEKESQLGESCGGEINVCDKSIKEPHNDEDYNGHKKKKKRKKNNLVDELSDHKEDEVSSDLNNDKMVEASGLDHHSEKKSKKKDKSNSKNNAKGDEDMKENNLSTNDENVKRKKTPKKKLQADSKILNRARHFVSEPREAYEAPTEEEKLKKKMKEMKREKMHLKKMKKKEEKEKEFKRKETDEFAEHAISYLHLWDENKNSWNFKKNLQMWLLNNMYDESKMKDNDFQLLLQYMLHSKGAAKQRTIEQAENMIKCWDNREDGVEKLESSIKNVEHVTESLYQRARDVVQILV